METLSNLLLKEINGKMRYVRMSSPKAEPPLPRKDQITLCKPDCNVCFGAGWVREDHPLSHPLFGKLTACPNADPYVAYGEKLGIDRKDLELSWASIVFRQEANTREAVNSILEVIQLGSGWVYLHGGYGLAKTMLLKIVVAEMLREGRTSAYARMAEVVENLRRAYDEKDNAQVEADARLKFWKNMPVLCLDEFDRLRNTEFETEKKFVLMDHRYDEEIQGHQTNRS
jgi:hypothetical protein